MNNEILGAMANKPARICCYQKTIWQLLGELISNNVAMFKYIDSYNALKIGKGLTFIFFLYVEF